MSQMTPLPSQALVSVARPTHDLTITIDNIETISGAILHIDNISVNRAEDPKRLFKVLIFRQKLLQLRQLLLSLTQ